MVSLAPRVLGELLSLGTTAQDLYDRCSKASSEFQEAKTELLALQTALTHLDFLTKSPLFNAGVTPSSAAPAAAVHQKTIEGGAEKGLLTAPPADTSNGENEEAKISEIKEGEETSLITTNNETGITTQNNDASLVVATNGAISADDWPDDSFLPQKTREDIKNLAIGCQGVLMDFDKLLTNHKAMEKARENARIWKPGTLLDRYRFSNKFVEVNDLRTKLTYHTSAITMMLTVLGSSSLGRIEGSLSKLENMMAQAAIERQRPIQNTAVFINSPSFQHLSPQEQARFLQGDPEIMRLLANQPDILGSVHGGTAKPRTSGGGGHGAKMIDWDKGDKYLIDSWEKKGRPGSSGGHGLFGRSSSTRKTKGRDVALVRSRTMPAVKFREDEEGSNPSKKKGRDWGESFFQNGWESSRKEREERIGIFGKEKSSSKKKKMGDVPEYSGDDGPPPTIEEEEKEREREKERGGLAEDQEKEKYRSQKSRSKESTPRTPTKEKKKSDWGENHLLAKSRPSPVKSRSDTKVPTRAKGREGEENTRRKRSEEEAEKKGKEKGAAPKKPSSKDRDKGKEGESREEREKRRGERRSKEKGSKEITGDDGAEGEGEIKEKSLDNDGNKEDQSPEALQFDLSKQDEEVESGEMEGEKKDDKLAAEETPPTNETTPKEDTEPKSETKLENETNADPAGEKREKKERKSKSSKEKDKDKDKEKKEKVTIENGDADKKHRSKRRRGSGEREKESSSDKIHKSSKNKESKDDASVHSSTKSAGSATGEIPKKEKDRDRRHRESSHRPSKEAKERPIMRRTRSLSPAKRRGGVYDIQVLKSEKEGKERDQRSGGLKNKTPMAMVKMALGDGALKSGREKDRERKKEKEKAKERER